MTDYTKILPTGKKNAILSKDLAFLMGFDNTRSLQADIAKSRDAGQVILSSSTGGYYLPANDEEIEEFIAVLRARAINTFKALRSAKMALEASKDMQMGQMQIDDILEDGSSLLKEVKKDETIDTD